MLKALGSSCNGCFLATMKSIHAFAVICIIASACSLPDENSIAQSKTMRIECFEIDSVEYQRRLLIRQSSFKELLDTSKFDGMVIGNVASISTEEHFQDLHLVLGTAEFVRLFQFLKKYESEKDKSGNNIRRALQPSSMSTNIEFVRRVVSEGKIQVHA